MCWGCIYKAQNIVQVQQNFVSVLRVPVAVLWITTEPGVSSIQATCPFVSETQKEAVTFLPQEDVRAHLSVAVLRRACRGLLKVLSCRTFMGSLGVWPWYKISIFFRIVWDSFFLAKLIFEDLFLKETVSASCGTGYCYVSFLYEKSSSCYSHYPPFHTRQLTSVHQWLSFMRTCLCG